MKRVTAKQITLIDHCPERAECLGFFGEPDLAPNRTKLFHYTDGTEGYVEMDFVDGQVGDWVVFWESGFTTVYSRATFRQCFKLEENTKDQYLTNLQGITTNGTYDRYKRFPRT